MKGDQVVRGIVAASTVTTYGLFVGLNGTGPVEFPYLGQWDPFAAVLCLLMLLAFPELIDRLPFGPTRGGGKKGS